MYCRKLLLLLVQRLSSFQMFELLIKKNFWVPRIVQCRDTYSVPISDGPLPEFVFSNVQIVVELVVMMVPVFVFCLCSWIC